MPLTACLIWTGERSRLGRQTDAAARRRTDRSHRGRRRPTRVPPTPIGQVRRHRSATDERRQGVDDNPSRRQRKDGPRSDASPPGLQIRTHGTGEVTGSARSGRRFVDDGRREARQSQHGDRCVQRCV